jgi:hypothetical protein
MMIYLLDANVLIALGDSNHPHPAVALRFFEQLATVEGWATFHFGRAPDSCQPPQRARTPFLGDDLSILDTRFFSALPVSCHPLNTRFPLIRAIRQAGNSCSICWRTRTPSDRG